MLSLRALYAPARGGSAQRSASGFDGCPSKSRRPSYPEVLVRGLINLLVTSPPRAVTNLFC